MRITYYTFPDSTSEEVLLENGCCILLKDGSETYSNSIPEDKRDLVQGIDHTINCSVSKAKQLMKKYGGSGITEHIDRDGCLFETTPVRLTGNNSRFKYNHHL